MGNFYTTTHFVNEAGAGIVTRLHNFNEVSFLHLDHIDGYILPLRTAADRHYFIIIATTSSRSPRCNF